MDTSVKVPLPTVSVNSFLSGTKRSGIPSSCVPAVTTDADVVKSNVALLVDVSKMLKNFLKTSNALSEVSALVRQIKFAETREKINALREDIDRHPQLTMHGAVCTRRFCTHRRNLRRHAE